jgi:hypothetical protein
MEVQRWERGNLVLSKPLVEVPHCTLRIDNLPWMFESDTCINGLAHGSGLAASLDGERLVVDGRFILGRMVDGEVLILRPQDS